jgi:hypothetical protein
MANTIKNFIIGIGYDYDKKGEKKIESGIDSIKSKALQLGAVVGGAFGIKSLTTDFANAKDELGRFAEVFGVTASDANAFGLALQREGGTLDSFLGQLQNIEKLRSGTLVGQAAFLSEAGKAGVDAKVLLDADDATEGLIQLADQFENLSQQERINAAAALGLDETMIRLLSKGSDEVRRLIENQRRMRDTSEEMTKVSREFNAQFSDLKTNIGGFAEQISIRLVPALGDVLGDMNSWIEINRDFLDSGLNDFLDSLAENFGLVAGGLSLIAASKAFTLLRGLSKLPLVGGLVGAGAGAGAAATGVLGAGALGYAAGTAINETFIEGNRELEDFFGRGAAFIAAGLGSESAQRALQSDSQNVTVQLMLDGQVLDERTIDTMNKEFERTQTDITSTNEG